MVDIGTSPFSCFEQHASKIKRLKFERVHQCNYFYYATSSELMGFVNAEEIHVNCADGFRGWGTALHDFSWLVPLTILFSSTLQTVELREARS